MRRYTRSHTHSPPCTRAGHTGAPPSTAPSLLAGPSCHRPLRPPAPSSILPASLSLVPWYPSHLLILLLNSRRRHGSCGRGEMDGPGGGGEGGQRVTPHQDGALGFSSPAVSQERCPVGLRQVWAAPWGRTPSCLVWPCHRHPAEGAWVRTQDPTPPPTLMWGVLAPPPCVPTPG